MAGQSGFTDCFGYPLTDDDENWPPLQRQPAGGKKWTRKAIHNLPDGFANSKSRRAFLQAACQTNHGVQKLLLKDLKLKFAFSVWPLQYQKLKHLNLAYEHSIGFYRKNGHFLHEKVVEDCWSDDFEMEIENLLVILSNYVEADDDDSDTDDESFKNFYRSKRTVPVEFQVLFNPSRNIVADILQTLPAAVRTDMRWCCIWNNSQLESLAYETITDLYNYCFAFFKVREKRFFPGLHYAEKAGWNANITASLKLPLDFFSENGPPNVTALLTEEHTLPDNKTNSQFELLGKIAKNDGIRMLWDIRYQLAFSKKSLVLQPLSVIEKVYEDSRTFFNSNSSYIHGEASTHWKYKFFQYELDNLLIALASQNGKMKYTANELSAEEAVHLTSKDVLTKIDPHTVVDMRWCLLWDHRKLYEIPPTTIKEVEKYCTEYFAQEGARLFKGIWPLENQTRWKVERHTEEMITLFICLGELFLETQFLWYPYNDSPPRLPDIPTEYPYGYTQITYTDWENILMKHGVATFLNSMSPPILSGMRSRCPFPSLRLSELSPLVLLQLFRNEADSPDDPLPESNVDFSVEMDSYKKKYQIWPRFRLHRAKLPNPILEEAKDEGVYSFLKSVVFTSGTRRILEIRWGLRYLHVPLTDIPIEVIYEAHMKCSTWPRMVIPEYYFYSSEWLPMFRLELEYYSMIGIECDIITMNNERLQLCEKVSSLFHIGAQVALGFLGRRYQVVLYSMRLSLETTERLQEIPKQVLWWQWFDIANNGLASYFRVKEIKDDSRWTNDFSEEMEELCSTLPISADREEQNKITKALTFAGKDHFIKIISLDTLKKMVCAAHQIYHCPLPALGITVIYGLFNICNNPANDSMDIFRDLEMNWHLYEEEVKTLYQVENVYLLEAFNRFPREHNIRPQIATRCAVVTDGDEDVPSFAGRKGNCNSYMKTVPFTRIRWMRIEANKRGYRDVRLEHIDSEALNSLFADSGKQNFAKRATCIEMSKLTKEQYEEITEFAETGTSYDTFSKDYVDGMRQILDSEAELKPVVKTYYNRRRCEIRQVIWQEQWMLFPPEIQDSAEMPEDWWNQCEDWLIEARSECFRPRKAPTWNEIVNDENLLCDTVASEPDQVPLSNTTLLVHRSPKITYDYLKYLLIHSTMDMVEACEHFLRKHYSRIVLDSPDLIETVENLSPTHLGVIYMFLSSKNDHRVGNTKQVHREWPRAKSICSYCFDQYSHFTNHCVRKYTQAMRDKSLADNGTCTQCGMWAQCTIKNNHPLSLLTCSSCPGPQNHVSNMCKRESKWLYEYPTIVRNVRLVVKATFGSLKEYHFVSLYREIVSHFKANKDKPNAYNYPAMDVTKFNWPLIRGVLRATKVVPTRGHSPAPPKAPRKIISPGYPASL